MRWVVVIVSVLGMLLISCRESISEIPTADTCIPCVRYADGHWVNREGWCATDCLPAGCPGQAGRDGLGLLRVPLSDRYGPIMEVWVKDTPRVHQEMRDQCTRECISSCDGESGVAD